MRKQDLAEQVSKETDISPEVVALIIGSTFEVISQSAHDGKKVKIDGFGSFASKERGGYKKRMPGNESETQISKKKALTFSPSTKQVKQL